MAPQRSRSPGRTASFYRKNPESYRKKLAYMKKYNARPDQIKYRTNLKIQRLKRGIDGKGGADLSHTESGRLVRENPRTNRARNGHGNNGRLKKG